VRQSIHHHYEQLTKVERYFVDTIFDGKVMYEMAAELGIPLKGDDTVERAVDALARAVIESRKGD
jgi:FixJ family two-component response regulator